jgi:Flp pilus assembly pilin Flp
MIKALRAFLADKTAAAAIEYSLLAAGIGLVILPIINTLGVTLAGVFTTLQTALQ